MPSSALVGCKFSRNGQAKTNKKDARSPSTTVFTEAGRGMKRKMTSGQIDGSKTKRRTLVSPTKIAIEAQPKWGSPQSETTKVLSFSKAEPSTKNAQTSAPTITITNGKRRRKNKAKKTKDPKEKRRKILTHSEAAFSDADTAVSSESPSPSFSRVHLKAKYRQEGLLNKGGFGAVYFGHRKSDNLPVAMKHIFKPSLKCISMFVNGVRRIFPREVALMLKVKGTAQQQGSSAVVDLLDWYELPSELILIMERPVPCLDLYDYLNTRTSFMQEKKGKIIIKQLVNALIGIHSRGVFHSDIKLENILIETGCDVPRIWIIDFGCATLLSDHMDTTMHGTLVYAPPEWFLNGSYKAEPTTVWQIGVVMYTILHSSLPFENKLEIIENEPNIRDGLSLDCQRFLLRSLNKFPKARATLEELKHHPWLL